MQTTRAPAVISELQRKAAQAIVNLFETGRVRGDYAKVTLLPGDTGHLTYGRSQTTLASGNLYLLIRAYCRASGAEFADELARFLPALEARDVNLDHDHRLHRLLRHAGADPVMRAVQDGFFDRVYWEPAVRAAERLGISAALGIAVVYDSHVHGSWRRTCDLTLERAGPVAVSSEMNWIEQYVAVRRDWLASHSNRLLGRTVYRMDAFTALIHEGRWDLELPFVCRGTVVDQQALGHEPDARAHDGDDEARLLRLRTPFMRGDDVSAIQSALTRAGFELAADGVFGPVTDAAVRDFQARSGLVVDGIVGQATRAGLASR